MDNIYYIVSIADVSVAMTLDSCLKL